MIARATKTPRVFISHAEEDRAFARQVARELKKAGFGSWTLDEVFPGDNFFLKVGQALEGADAMVIILSPQAVKSPNLQREIGYVIGEPRFAGRVFPVVIRPTRDIPWVLGLDAFKTIHATNKNPARVAKQVAAAIQEAIEV